MGERLVRLKTSELLRAFIADPGEPTLATEIDRRLDDEFSRVVTARLGAVDTLRQVDHEHAAPEIERVIDKRPCQPLIESDVDWGEQDSLANVPTRLPDYPCEQDDLGELAKLRSAWQAVLTKPGQTDDRVDRARTALCRIGNYERDLLNG